MFRKNITTENTRFNQQYCKGFNVGISLVKKIPTERWELTKEVLHAMILEQPKDISFHSILTGFTYEIVNVRSKEHQAQRIKEIQKINQKTKNREPERGR